MSLTFLQTWKRSSLWPHLGQIGALIYFTVQQTCKKDRQRSAKWLKKLFKKQTLAGSFSMSSITSHFHITWFVCFSCCSPAYLLLKKKSSEKKAVRRSINQQSVGVSQHTGTGRSSSGSLSLGHYVIRWAQFALLVACEGSPVSGAKLKKLALSTPPGPPSANHLYKPESIQTAAVSRHF